MASKKKLSTTFLALFLGAFSTFSALAIPVANDRTQTSTFKKKGVQSYIINGDCEKNDTLGITDAAGIMSRTTGSTSLGDEQTDCLIDATTSGQKVIHATNRYPYRIAGQPGEVTLSFSGDASLYKVNVVQNSVTIASQQLYSAVGVTNTVTVPFLLGTDPTQALTVEIEATSNSAAAVIYVINHVGESTNVGTVAQPQMILSARRITSSQTFTVAAGTVWVLNSAIYDPYNGLNTSTGVYTMRQKGRVYITGATVLNNMNAATGYLMQARKNTTVQNGCVGYTNVSTISAITMTPCQFDVSVGDTVDILMSNDNSDTSWDSFPNWAGIQIMFLPDPVTVTLPTNSAVYVEAGGTPTGSLSGASPTIWGTEIKDYTGSYNPSTGEFTAPYTGEFCWTAGAQYTVTSATNNQVISLAPYVNGVVLTRFGSIYKYITNAGSQPAMPLQSNGCTTVPQGQTLTFRSNSNATGAAFGNNDAVLNGLTIWSAVAGQPKPYIPGSVYAPSNSIEKITRAQITCSAASAVDWQGGTWLTSVGNVSSGACAVTFSGTPFSNSQYACSFLSQGTSTTTLPGARISSKTTSGFTMTTIAQTAGSTAAGTTSTFDVICTGPSS